MQNPFFRTLCLIGLFVAGTASAQVSYIGYSPEKDATLLFYKVKGIDTVRIPGNWEIDKRDLATSVYLKNQADFIGFYLSPKNKKYRALHSEADCLKQYVADKTRKLRRSGWDFELLDTDGLSYQLYRITSARHPDANQLALLGCRGEYVYNIVSYSAAGDEEKSRSLISIFNKTEP